ncbi:hypothetical protein DITRI_Ditri07aG0024700 [Diplodiscus trichospermus]
MKWGKGLTDRGFGSGQWNRELERLKTGVRYKEKSSSKMAMYIRVKRSKTTYFIQCDPTETTLVIKQKLHNLIDQPVNDQRLILLHTREILEDSKTLADQKVENDAVVALTLRKGCVFSNFLFFSFYLL